MKRFLSLLGILLTLTCTGCIKSRFTVEFQLPSSIADSYSMLYYASDSEKGWLQEKVAVPQGGKCSMELLTVNPTLVYVFQGSLEPGLVFYAERGDRIELKGDNPDPGTWTVTGNDINDALTSWRLSNRDVLAARDSQRINAAVAKYVAANPDKPAATLILLLYYYRGEDRAGFDRLFNSLKGDAADPEWTNLVNRNDLLAGFEPSQKKTGALILRTYANGCDTIPMTAAKTLLYFSNNGIESRTADIIRLRELIRERKDSASLPVVNVNMEPDSAAWSYQLRNDSLRGAVQAWMPLGFSDPDARRLGVAGIPYFIVIEKGGRILYRGADIEKALEKAK